MMYLKKKKNFVLPWTWPVSCFLSCVRLNSLFIENSKQLTAGTMTLQWKRVHNNLKKPEHRCAGLRQGRSGVSSTKPTETKWNYRKKKSVDCCVVEEWLMVQMEWKHSKGINNLTNIGFKIWDVKTKKSSFKAKTYKKVFCYCCFIIGQQTWLFDCEILELNSSRKTNDLMTLSVF